MERERESLREGVDPFDACTLAELRQRRSEKWATYPPDVLPAFVAEMDAARLAGGGGAAHGGGAEDPGQRARASHPPCVPGAGWVARPINMLPGGSPGPSTCGSSLWQARVPAWPYG
jgi:hypothetical protein